MKIFKKIITCALVGVILAMATFSLTACEDLRTLEINVSVVNVSDSTPTDYTLTVKLYRHLAPGTVDAIVSYASEGYYDGVTFYRDTDTSIIMAGDFNFDGKTVTQKDEKPAIKGEFKNNGVTGSDLVNDEGYVGLWRNYSDYTVSEPSRDSGRATIYMPTTSKTSYDGFFCVFGKFDVNGDDNRSAWTAIKNVFDSSLYSETYVIYYTGEYNKDDSVKDNGLTFHCVTSGEFDNLPQSEKDNVFTPDVEEGQYKNYAKRNVKLPVFGNNKTDRVCGAYIKNVKVK